MSFYLPLAKTIALAVPKVEQATPNGTMKLAA